ncbi:hypothetical protein GDO86_017591 [Hymenochirus boettgeri]|uniref:Uncharacterized protein n=1 Tax=Hymenochirus boettgeri TaxID=247094 RepID=A0A8T2IT65_9PIPI|nr:hypothetical protein GDO86_017591 [Hymenochirus boettgeri]
MKDKAEFYIVTKTFKFSKLAWYFSFREATFPSSGSLPVFSFIAFISASSSRIRSLRMRVESGSAALSKPSPVQSGAELFVSEESLSGFSLWKLVRISWS